MTRNYGNITIAGVLRDTVPPPVVIGMKISIQVMIIYMYLLLYVLRKSNGCSAMDAFAIKWMPLEVLQGREFTLNSDIWSFGTYF